jgi:hypothetical protein
VPPPRIIYIGDNLGKDIPMAREAGVIGVWAKFGTTRRPRDLALLERVCHWPGTTAARERARAGTVRSGVVLEHGFAELLKHFSFS